MTAESTSGYPGSLGINDVRWAIMFASSVRSAMTSSRARSMLIFSSVRNVSAAIGRRCVAKPPCAHRPTGARTP